jgi:hypothetical protein
VLAGPGVWQGGRMRSAASCGPTGGDDDESPGVVQEEGDDEGEDD